MNGKELSHYVQGKITAAEKKVKEGYSPDEQEFLNELVNYYNHLKKEPDNFEGRKGFLEDFKTYFTKPYAEKIDDFEKRMVDKYNKNMNKIASHGLWSKAGFYLLLVGAGLAIGCNPAFWVLAGGGLGLAVGKGMLKEKGLENITTTMNTINILKEGLINEKDKLESIKPENLEEALLNNMF